MAEELDPFYTSEVSAPPPPDVSKPLTGMEVARSAYEHLGPSAVKAAKELVYPFTHAPETVAGLKTLGAGIASKAAPYVGAQYRSPEGEQALGAIADYYKQRYGSVEGAKRAMAEDPIGTMMDVSTVLTGGGGALRGAGLGVTKAAELAGTAGRIGRGLGAAGEIVGEAGRLVDPVAAATKLGAMAATPVTKGVLPELLAIHTGKSPESFRRAEEAGAIGDSDFVKHLWGSGKPEEVIEKTQNALQSIKDQRSQEYLSTSQGWKSSQVPLTLDPANKKLYDIVQEYTPSGGRVARYMHGPLNEIKDTIDHYANTGKTMSDLDLLKKDLDKLYYSPEFRNPEAKAALTQVRQSVWQTIADHDPVYADIMGKYEQATNEINSIVSDIGTDKASTAARLRKLIKAGGADTVKRLAKEEPSLPYMIAGQELSPAGLGGIRGALASGLYMMPAFATFNPLYALGAGLAVPRVAGTLQSAAGAARVLPMKMEQMALPQAARRGVMTTQKPRFEASVTAAEPTPEAAEDYFYNRPGRATGGSISRAMTADRLIGMLESAHKNNQTKTESILDQPDEHVVHALKVANSNI